MRFYRPLALALVLLFGTILYFYLYLGHYDERDRAAYQRLLYPEVLEKETHTSIQRREGLLKEIFLNKNGEHLKFRLRSENANLAFVRHDNKMDIIEEMKEMACSVQEECFFRLADGGEAHVHSDGRLLVKDADPKDPASWLSSDSPGIKPVQRVVDLEAEMASYYYSEGYFIADNVKLSEYETPTHHLDDFAQERIYSATAEAHRLECKDLLASEEKKVVLTGDVVIEANRGTLPLNIKSQRVNIQIGKSDEAGRPVIDEIVAEDSVVISYDRDFEITSDYATYQREKSADGKEARLLPGVISMHGKTNDDLCHLTSHIGFFIDAKQVDIDTNSRVMKFTPPVNMRLSHQDMSGAYTLKCTGPLKVDHLKMEARFESDVDENGLVAEDKQVYFQDAKGEIYADRALVKYQSIDKAFAPTKIVLLGNVRIFNRLSAAPKANENVLQYVLAERVDFFPLTKEMVFKAKPGQRVLFFDKANKLEVSAETLKIIRDQATNKETIQGTGDVRFSFVEHELEQLRRKFAFDRSKE